MPGDIVITGTPSGVGPLKHGDVVEVEIEKIESQINEPLTDGKILTHASIDEIILSDLISTFDLDESNALMNLVNQYISDGVELIHEMITHRQSGNWSK